MADIYDEIRDDHKNQRELLETISNAEDAKTRGEAWKKFYYDVKAHAAAEEETFYAKLIANPKGQNDARHSVAEHKQLDDLMEKLNTSGLAAGNWRDTFDKLKHDYEHHIDEEEDEIFKKAKKLFDGGQAEKFADHFAKRKKAELELVDQKAEESLEE